MGKKNRSESTKSRPQWETLDEWIRQQVQGFIQGVVRPHYSVSLENQAVGATAHPGLRGLSSWVPVKRTTDPSVITQLLHLGVLPDLATSAVHRSATEDSHRR